MKDLKARLVLLGSNEKMLSMLRSSENNMRRFSSVAQREFQHIKNAARSVEGRLGALGVAFGAAVIIKSSANLDKNLTRIGQTGQASRVQVIGLRRELYRMAKETGADINQLREGFDAAVQSGLTFKEALPVLDGINKTQAVTGASAKTLANALTVAGTAFKFDLSKPDQAQKLLDKMTVAGRLGSAEVENLADVFARSATNAVLAGMSFEKTLAFAEVLSKVEKNPERLQTLYDSTLRLFTNVPYMVKAMQGTGVKFFDAKGARRDVADVLKDMAKKYNNFKTDQQKTNFIGRAFGEVDTETRKGIADLLKDPELIGMINTFTSDIEKAPGRIKKDLPEAIDNAVDQVGRLKAVLGEAADEFSQHLNTGISNTIKKLLDSKEKGGFGLTGDELIAGGTAIAAGGYTAYRLGGPALRKILGRLGGTASRIAMGKAVEAATGVSPVFVTNWPAEGTSLPISTKEGLKKIPSWLTGMGTGALLLHAAAGMAAIASVGTASYAAIDVIRGGNGKNWISNGWNDIQSGWYGNVLYDLIHGATSPKIELNVYSDRDGRVKVDANDMNVKANTINSLPRGKF